MQVLHANRGPILYYSVVVLLILFLFYHALSVQVVQSAEFPADVPSFICPLASLH
ncbi:MAG: hypothetical protein ACPG8W_12585 [Candidatus Promineifilaceae bacterium]